MFGLSWLPPSISRLNGAVRIVCVLVFCLTTLVHEVSLPVPEHSLVVIAGEPKFQQLDPSDVPFTYESMHDNGEFAATKSVPERRALDMQNEP